jgi:hypothetical protein
MSHAQDDEAVGYGKPPKKHRFSSENQPARRRKKKARPRGGVYAGLKDAFRQEVEVLKNGKLEEQEYIYALGRKIAQDLAIAPLGEKLKAFAFLRKEGVIDHFDIEASLDDERRALQEEREVVEALWQAQKYFADVAREERAQAITLMEQIRSICTCGACEGELQAALDQVRASRETDEESEADAAIGHGEPPLSVGEGWAVTAPPPFGDDLTDEFYTGQLGYD